MCAAFLVGRNSDELGSVATTVRSVTVGDGLSLRLALHFPDRKIRPYLNSLLTKHTYGTRRTRWRRHSTIARTGSPDFPLPSYHARYDTSETFRKRRDRENVDQAQQYVNLAHIQAYMAGTERSEHPQNEEWECARAGSGQSYVIVGERTKSATESGRSMGVLTSF